ncbi:MAG: SAP domain-containing protein [Fibrobacteraceae bacterium]
MYYWYREELKQICRKAGIDCDGTKQELNHNIEEYFKGNTIGKKKTKSRMKVVVVEPTLETKLLECGFCFSQRFRNFFSKQTGIIHFKFNADMVATSKKVKQDNDVSFTLRDMLNIYYGRAVYAKYDNSSCQWNKFLKDFCADGENSKYTNKLKVASILWNEVRNSTKEKVYNKDLIYEYGDKIESCE